MFSRAVCFSLSSSRRLCGENSLSQSVIRNSETLSRRINKLLVANRAEIALRIFRTCRAMAISTVGVYSDAVRETPHARAAGESVYIGGDAPPDSYSNIEAIIDAARRTGADAIHPGYGFLSENADLASACENAGITFVGPRPDTIRRMGLKSVARGIANAAGVQVVPGYDGQDQTPSVLREAILRIGFPALVK